MRIFSPKTGFCTRDRLIRVNRISWNQKNSSRGRRREDAWFDGHRRPFFSISLFLSFSFFFFVSLAFNLNDAFSFRISRSFRWHFKSWRWSENRNKSRFNLRLGDVLCLRFYWFHCMLHALLRLYFIALMSSKCMNAIFFVLTDLARIRGKSDESTFVIWFG